MNAQAATSDANDIKSYVMKYYHQLPVTEDNSKAVRAAAWALLANVLISDYLNRWNEARGDDAAGNALLKDAEKAVGEALRLDDTFALAHYANGLIHRANERRAAALEAFERAIIWDPTFARAYAQKGSELINEGKFDEALPEIDKAIACGPNDPSAGMFYWNRGRAFFFKEEYRKAIEPLRKAVALRANLWHNHLYLASAYWKVEDKNNAKKILEEFKKTHPDYTPQKVMANEKANPSDHLRKGRDTFYEALQGLEGEMK